MCEEGKEETNDVNNSCCSPQQCSHPRRVPLVRESTLFPRPHLLTSRRRALLGVADACATIGTNARS